MTLIYTVQAIFDPITEAKEIEEFRRNNSKWFEETTTTSVSFTLQHTAIQEIK